MVLDRLRRLADDFFSASPSELEELAVDCWNLGVQLLDVRYMVLVECLRSTVRFWGDSENGGVSTSFAEALARTWRAYLPGVLDAPSEETGTAVALALKEELSLLAGEDPLSPA